MGEKKISLHPRPHYQSLTETDQQIVVCFRVVVQGGLQVKECLRLFCHLPFRRMNDVAHVLLQCIPLAHINCRERCQLRSQDLIFFPDHCLLFSDCLIGLRPFMQMLL